MLKQLINNFENKGKIKMSKELIKQNVKNTFQLENDNKYMSNAERIKVTENSRKGGSMWDFSHKSSIKSNLSEIISDGYIQNSGTDGKQTITLIRGLPGAGKTTYALKMDAKHVEADLFFNKRGKYCFEGNKVKDAHAWCQSQVKYYLNQGENVVVSNTFTRIEEMKPYIEVSNLYGASLQIIECTGNYQSVHDVPVSTIANMRNRWEMLPNELKHYLITNPNALNYQTKNIPVVTGTKNGRVQV